LFLYTLGPPHERVYIRDAHKGDKIIVSGSFPSPSSASHQSCHFVLMMMAV